MKRRARALFTAVASLALVSAASAQAQTREDDEAKRAEARAIAEQGDAAFASGRCDLAIPLWQRADAAFHAPTIMLRVARCQSLLGHVVDASATLRAIVDEKLGADAPPAFAVARETAAHELAATSARIASLRVRVEGPGSAVAVVEIDGLASPLGATLRVDPGDHHVFVRVEGATYEQTVSLTDGERREVKVAVLLEQPPAVVPTQRKVGYAIGGVGAAVMVVGGVFGVLSLSPASALSSACGADRQHCPAGDAADINTLKSRAFAADLSLGSGLAVLIGGAVVALTAGRGRAEAPIVRLQASAGGLSLDGSF